MNDERDNEILDAYDRLDGSLAPTGDPVPGVELAIRHRRAVRRVAAGGAALAVVAVVGGVVAVQGAGGSRDLAAVDQPSPTAVATPTGPVSTLSITRTDGSTYVFDAASLKVTCSPGENGAGQVLTLRTAEPAFAPDNPDTLLEPLFSAEVSVDQVAPGEIFDLPFESADGSSESRSLTVFFATPEGRERANELSSAESGAAGTATIDSAVCGPTPSISFSVDATLGSEVSQPAMAIAGAYRS